MDRRTIRPRFSRKIVTYTFLPTRNTAVPWSYDAEPAFQIGWTGRDVEFRSNEPA
jgi:hypothetical protein